MDAGCDVNHSDNHGDTALMHALRHDFDALLQRPVKDTILICDFMLQYGSKLMSPGNEGQTALSLAEGFANKHMETMMHNAIGVLNFYLFLFVITTNSPCRGYKRL